LKSPLQFLIPNLSALPPQHRWIRISVQEDIGRAFANKVAPIE